MTDGGKNKLTRKDFDNPIVEGSVLSDNLTPTMKAVKAIIEYIAKMAVTISEQDATGKVEKKEGLPYFLKEKARIEKNENKTLSPQELIDLENKTRYEIFQSKIGNKTEIMRFLFMSVCTEDNKDWQSLVSEMKRESAEIANKVLTISRATDDNDARRYL